VNLSAEKRAELRELQRRVDAIKADGRRDGKVRAKAERKARDRALTGEHGQRQTVHRDRAYMGWIHDQGLPCVACEAGDPIPPNLTRNRIEAAHQWTIRGPMKGRKTDDWTCVPLCTWHHQDAPNACDKGQRQFWLRLAIEIEPLARALYAAFKAGEPGLPVIHRFIRISAAMRCGRAS
jgi:hypothetical protein